MKYLILAGALTLTPAVATAGAHELLLDIPAAGKLKTTVQKTVRKAQDGQTVEIVTAYDITDTYACEDETCTVRTSIPSVTLKSFNGQVPPPGVDTSAATGAFRLLDGVSWTGDSSFLPEKLNGLTEIKANYVRVMTAEAAQRTDEATRKSPEFKAGIEKAVDQVLTSMGGEGLIAAFAPERGLLSWPHNTSLTVAEPVKQAVAFASPFDGAPLEADLTMTLVSWDDAKKTAVITFDIRPNEAAMAAYVEKITPQVLTSLGGAAAGAAGDVKGVAIRSATSCRYEMDTVSGLARKADCSVEKGAVIAGVSRVTEEHYVMSESLVE